MFYRMIERKRDQWFASGDCTVRTLIDYISKAGQMRDAQVEAIKTYLFLKVACDCKTLNELFTAGTFNSLDIGELSLPDSVKDFLRRNPAAAALYEYASQANDSGEQVSKKLQEQIEALTARLDQQDKAEKQKATLLAAEQSAKAAGCTDERALKLTSKLFSIKDDESDEDVAKRFKEEYDANIKEFFGDGAVPYRGARISTPTTVSAADKAKQAREDAKRVREG